MSTSKKTTGDKLMYLALLNHSKDSNITVPLLNRIAHALETQLYQDYAPLWQGAGVPVKVITTTRGLPLDVCPLVIFDAPDQAGALGWHTYSPDGHIFGRAFWNPIKENGGTLTEGATSLSATLSHEALEAVEDPYANCMHMKDDDTLEWREICDRVEGDAYVRETVSVSNFLGPRAFRDGPGPYDHMSLLTNPWEVRPNGYCERLSITTGKVDTIWGHKFPEWKKAFKQKHSRKSSRLMSRR